MSCENCKYLIIQNGFEPRCIKGGIPFYSGECPLFEYDKNIDNYRTAKPKKEIITNRQWVNSLSNEDFVDWYFDNKIKNKKHLIKWLGEKNG